MAFQWWSAEVLALMVLTAGAVVVAWRRLGERRTYHADWGVDRPVRRPDAPDGRRDPTEIEAVYEWQHVRLHFIPERCRLEVRSADGAVKAAVPVSRMERDGLVIHWGGDPLFLPEDADFDGADRFIEMIDAVVARGGPCPA